MLIDLRTRLTLDDALVLADLQQVGASWQHANAKNADALRDLERDREGR
jgi:hypothetical protein